ncbi:MAG: DMT family transporter [Pseudomonadota bacterium]
MQAQVKPASLTMPAHVWMMLLALSVLWGGSFLFVGIAVADLPPFTIVLLRVGLAAAALLVALRIAGHSVPTAPALWLAFLGMGLLNNAIPFSLIVWGQTQIASGLASILNATTPVFGVLVAHWMTADERLSGMKLAGVILGFSGVAVMIGWDALGGLGVAVLAQVAILGAALSYAFAGVFGRRFRAMGVPPMVTAFGQVSASTLLLAPLAFGLEQPWTLPVPSIESIAAIGGLAVLSTAMAYVLYFRILEAAGATNLLLVTFLIPPSAILMGWAALGERLDVRDFAGLALILAGLAAIDGRVLKRRPAP